MEARGAWKATTTVAVGAALARAFHAGNEKLELRTWGASLCTVPTAMLLCSVVLVWLQRRANPGNDEPKALFDEVNETNMPSPPYREGFVAADVLLAPESVAEGAGMVHMAGPGESQEASSGHSSTASSGMCAIHGGAAVDGARDASGHHGCMAGAADGAVEANLLEAPKQPLLGDRHEEQHQRPQPQPQPQEQQQTMAAGSEVEELVQALRGRLVDILGPVGGGEVEAAGLRTVARYGGEANCFRRFLHARRYDVAQAERMLRDTVEFRQQYQVNDLLTEPSAQARWRALRPTWPMTAPMFSAGGHPVIYFRMSHLLTFQKQVASEDEARTLYLCMMEQSLRLQRASRHRQLRHSAAGAVGAAEGELPQVCEIYDLQGLNAQHLRCILGIRLLLRVFALGQKHYPENLRTAIILNAPKSFERLWSLLRTVLDVRTQEKVRVARDEGREVLAEVLGASPEQIESVLRSIVPYGEEREGGLLTGSDLMDLDDAALFPSDVPISSDL